MKFKLLVLLVLVGLALVSGCVDKEIIGPSDPDAEGGEGSGDSDITDELDDTWMDDDDVDVGEMI